MVESTEGRTDALADSVSMALRELVRKAELDGVGPFSCQRTPLVVRGEVAANTETTSGVGAC